MKNCTNCGAVDEIERLRAALVAAQLGPLPEPLNKGSAGFGQLWNPLFSSEQMHAYAAAAVAAERERVAAACDHFAAGLADDKGPVERQVRHHTPGPWQTVEVGEYVTKLAVADKQGVSILTVVDEEGTKFAAVFNDADADVMAAASELLEALIAMEAEKADYMRINKLGDPAGEHTNRMARAAIAKAIPGA